MNSDFDEAFGGDSSSAEIVEGYVTSAPATVNELLKVAIPGQDGDMGGVRWDPRGDLLPAVGDRCLIVTPSNGGPWVPVWWPNAPEA